MNNFAVITKAEQDVAKAKAHLSVLKQKINDSKAKPVSYTHLTLPTN